VGLLTLYTGTLLPWLGGTFWLMFADARFGRAAPPNRFRQLGYGFFIGYAILFMAVLGSRHLTGGVSWPALMAFLSLFALAGAVAARLGRKPEAPASALPSGSLPVAKPLLVIAIALMAIHLVFIAVEIFTEPLYPWDAWLVWIYRAKAWYLSGGMHAMVNASEWAGADAANVYTMHAWQYPLFASVVPYWAALSLGRWSETLINLPVLFAGLAMGMALYGQCREQGLSIPASLVACYIFFSIPIIGTHLALAGYADIWMAGFAGLGFVAVMRGITPGHDGAPEVLQTLLGLLMILFSAWVKNEGVVWLLAAAAMIILATCRARVPLLIVAATVVVAVLAYTLGISHLDLPLIGTFGLVDGRLLIPFIGNFRLEAHDVSRVYWDNFFTMGSWNLFWLAVAGGLVAGALFLKRMPGRHARRTALSLILVFIAVQWFIFGFTDQGLWASKYTAINRLPIHFVPALLFAVMMVANAGMKQYARTAGDTNGLYDDS
jgi:hypothetical protein